MAECELLADCGFFRKYRDTLDMACRGFIKSYCNGSRMEDCRRKEYRQEHGEAPSEDMLPTGQMVPQSFR